ncbi:MAG: DUF885 domain-containing protein [Gemmatimonadetes bacterium]|nr:DUF885 domain-containing protein [Gemmatimonadota bacterium]
MSSFDDPKFDSWSRVSLGAHLGRHPVDATFIGVHQHDHRLPDASPEGIEETVDSMRSALRDEFTAGSHPSSSMSALDRRLVRGFLTSRVWEYESGHVSANPSTHTGDAVFGLMGPLLTRHGSQAERAEAVEARMAQIPGFLAGARELLGPDDGAVRWRPGGAGGVVGGSTIPAAWIRRAIRECDAGVRFVEKGLEQLRGRGQGAGQDGSATSGSTWATDLRVQAADAFRAFAHFLESEFLPSGSDDVACGSEAFEMLLRDGHFLSKSAEDVVAYARDELVRTRSWLESAASRYGGSSPEGVVDRLADLHPSADEYLARFGTMWTEMRDLALERELVTWPDFPIEYVERPSWARAAAPDLYFLFYRSPPAFQRPSVHRYMVAPLDDAASADEQLAFLRANNDSVIKLNHVVHHGGIGHHVQNWHAFRSPSLVGRIAAVDCASRIAMFCGGTMAEGWACYATDLMAEAGGLSDSEQYAAHVGRVRMCARAIVDVELHAGRMSLAEAAAFYREEAGMSGAAAEAESVKNSMFPGGALMYLIGTDMIHDLRRDIMRALGDDFDLRVFHDAFLSYGSIPVALVADEMRRRAAARRPLGAHDDVPGPAAWTDGLGAAT